MLSRADFQLLVWCIVFAFLNVLVLLAYTQVLKKPKVLDKRVDVIFISRGRNRLAIQSAIWFKKWKSISTTRFICIYTKNVIADETQDDSIIHIHSDYTSQEDIFLNMNKLVANDMHRSVQFLFVSDNVIPIQSTAVDIFWNNGLGWRFFNGIVPDMVLFGIEDKFELTIPVMLFAYTKVSKYTTYSEFKIAFIASKSHIFCNMAQIVVLPNAGNKIKAFLKNEIFQVVHQCNNDLQINELILEKWKLIT